MKLLIALLFFAVGVLVYAFLMKRSETWMDSKNRLKRMIGWLLFLILTVGFLIYSIVSHVKSCSRDNDSSQHIEYVETPNEWDILEAITLYRIIALLFGRCWHIIGNPLMNRLCALFKLFGFELIFIKTSKSNLGVLRYYEW